MRLGDLVTSKKVPEIRHEFAGETGLRVVERNLVWFFA